MLAIKTIRCIGRLVVMYKKLRRSKRKIRVCFLRCFVNGDTARFLLRVYVAVNAVVRVRIRKRKDKWHIDNNKRKCNQARKNSYKKIACF